MQERTVTHNTFVVEKTYAATPERVFAAFADPGKKRRWFAEGGVNKDVEEYTLDFQIGGSERARYRFGAGSPFPGVTLATDAAFLDIVPKERIVQAQTMIMAGHPISVTLATFQFLAEGAGTRLVLTHQAAFFEGADGPAGRERGWNVLLDNLGAELSQ